MHVSVDDAEDDYGTLVVQIERDDSVSLGGYPNNLTLRLPLYAREAQDIIDALTPIANAGKEAVTTGKAPIDIGGGYTVVPFGAVTLNGTFLSQLMESADGTLLVVIGPDGRALMGEGGRPYRYQTLDECRRDVETLMSVPGWKESK